MYPVLKNNVGLGTFCLDGFDNETHYYICCSNGNEAEISERLFNALLKADGTAPLDLPDEGKSVIPKLKRMGYIRTSRFEHDQGIFNRFTLFNLRSASLNNNLFLKAANALLPLLSVLLLILGIMLINPHATSGRQYVSSACIYCGMLFSIVAHETGHLAALASFGHDIYDAGILLLGIIPIGAYVAHNEKHQTSRRAKIQIALAGIEMNILIAGLCFILSANAGVYSEMLVIIGYLNIALTILNLIPAHGLDGELALSALFGVDSIYEIAKSNIFNAKLRHRLYRSGIKGIIYFLILLFVLVSNAFFIITTVLSLLCLFF